MTANSNTYQAVNDKKISFFCVKVATRSSHGLEADVWGLGCLLYTLLVGRPPFDTDAVKSTLTRVVMADYKVVQSCKLFLLSLIFKFILLIVTSQSIGRG